MKTLSEAVQVAIINEVGSTFRNSLMAFMRDAVDAKGGIQHGKQAAEQLANDLVKLAKSE